MSHLELWTLLSDILLFFALGYLCFQFVRSPKLNAASRQMRKLEGALRSLIKDADSAGRTLNDQLMRRQQALERLLIDAQLVEQRIEEGVRRPAQSAAEPAPVSTPRQSSSAAKRPAEPESFVRPPAPEVTVTEPEQEPARSFGRVNIYGEPIEEPAPATAKAEAPGRAMRRAMQTYSPLAAKIEKQFEANPAPAAKAAIEDIYAQAEEMLRAGNDLAVVAGRTKLPIQEVRALSQMLIGEEAVRGKSASASKAEIQDADPRLGVMATMKRQTITL